MADLRKHSSICQEPRPPETELASHYFDASLPRQFDAYVWFEVTRAITALPVKPREGMPETYPFGL